MLTIMLLIPNATSANSGIHDLSPADFQDYESIYLNSDSKEHLKTLSVSNDMGFNKMDFRVPVYDHATQVLVLQYSSIVGSNSVYLERGSVNLFKLHDKTTFLIFDNSSYSDRTLTFRAQTTSWHPRKANLAIYLYDRKSYQGYIDNFKAVPSYDYVDLSWSVKNNNTDDLILFYSDGLKTEELPVTQNTKKVTGLDSDTTYTFGLRLKTKTEELSDMALVTTKTLSDDISNLIYDQTHDAVTLKWDKPLHVKSGDKALIYQDGVLIKEISANQNSHTIDNLQDDTSYDFKVAIKRDNGNITEGLTVKVKTDKAPLVAAEIKNLNAVADHDRVDLSWQLPDSNGFKHVNIYRNEEVGLLKKMFGAIDPITVVHAADADNKIFETNGTYFNDLTVQPNTKYKYKLTTTTTDGQESTGVTVKVKTASTPPPVMGDNGVNLDSNGDYVIEWDSPITGDIQVKIDGQDYTTVSAANKKVIIPHADMVLDWMGHPKVQLIPIADDGTTGQATTPPVNAGPGASGGNGGSGGGTGGGNTIQTIGLPFGVDALVTSSFDLIYILGPFVLLGLALMFVPRLIKVIKKSIAERQNNKPVRF